MGVSVVGFVAVQVCVCVVVEWGCACVLAVCGCVVTLRARVVVAVHVRVLIAVRVRVFVAVHRRVVVWGSVFVVAVHVCVYRVGADVCRVEIILVRRQAMKAHLAAILPDMEDILTVQQEEQVKSH